MKRNKKIIILLAALICVSLAAFGVSRYEEKKEIIKNSDEIIMEVASEDVNVLSWECDTGSYAFHRDEDGGWLYDTDEAFPVDGEKIEGLLEQFQEFGVSFIIEEVEDFGQYGLETPVCTIHMETGSDTYEILLGNYSAMDSERYVSIGDGNAYLVKNDPLGQFEIEISDVILHDEIPYMEDVTQVQLSGAESEKIVYEEDSRNTYYAGDVYFMEQDAAKMPLDTTRVNDYLSTVQNLNLKDYVTYNATEEELQAYGMDAPELSIVLDYTVSDEETEGKTAGTFTLHVGRDPEEREKEAAENAVDSESEDLNGEESENMETEPESAEDGAEGENEVTAYARVGDSKIVYQITAEQYEKLMDMSYDSLRHQEMFWADFGDMYQLDILLEGKKYTITSEMEDDERTYYYQEEEQEMAGIRGAIRGLTATDFTDETPTEKEEISFTVYLDNENYPEVHIQLYRYDGNSCIAVVDGESVAFVERAKVIDLVETVNSIVLK
ncbi:MAG: DUF4340 domain-containing protein [Lachnospiraceae bacterium]|nr:DUF4340 domain-containing protein [Lachnospiraceae bacterium]